MSAPPCEPVAPAYYRQDGWTPERQRRFVEALAEGLTVEQGCRIVGLSVASAYALRKRAAGAGFAMGWHAAGIHARGLLADRMWSRAVDGYTETVTRADGSVVERHRYDNRLSMAMLTRLDRLADGRDSGDAFGRAARFVAQDLDTFLDTLEGGNPLDTAAWLTAHVHADVPAELASVAALRAAAHYLRDAANDDDEQPWEDEDEDEDDSDWTDAEDEAEEEAIRAALALDPAERQGWTADEWQLAESAGIVTPHNPPEGVTDPLGPQLPDAVPLPPPPSPWARRGDPQPAQQAAGPLRFFVWRIAADAPDRIWYTCFPPPEGFDGLARGDYGDDDYWRSCTVAEAAAAEAATAKEVEDQRVAEAKSRDKSLKVANDEKKDKDEPVSPDDIYAIIHKAAEQESKGYSG